MLRKRIDLTQELKNEISALVSNTKALNRNLSRIYVFDQIPPAKLRNATRSFARTMGKDETVILLKDGTFSGNAKNGFLLTTRRFYGKNLLANGSFVEIADITNIDYIPQATGAPVMMQIHSKNNEPLSKHIAYVGHNNEGSVVQLVEQIIYALQASIGNPAPTTNIQGETPPTTVRCSGCGATVQTGTVCKFCRILA